MEWLPCALATIGLMMSAVKAAIKALNARATARPTATVTMSPRMRKFRNPLSTLTLLGRFRDGIQHRSGPADHGITTISCSTRQSTGTRWAGTHLPRARTGQAWQGQHGCAAHDPARR